jgi:predicted DsbA family dithiol-disulfide isomerase
VEALARLAGLDAGRFAACLSAPETSRRLSEDVAAGIRDGIRALPTYVVNGTSYVGTLPAGLGAEPRAAEGPR